MRIFLFHRPLFRLLRSCPFKYLVLGALVWACMYNRAVAEDFESYWPISTHETKDLPPETTIIERAGPLFSKQLDSEGRVRMRTFRPFYIQFLDPETDTRDAYFLYPLFRRHVSPKGTRWSIFNIIQKRSEVDDDRSSRFRIFPIFSSDYSEEADESKNSVFPVKGKISHFFGKDSVSWFLFPFYLKSRKGEDRFSVFFWPFFQFQKGPKAGGRFFFPFCGYFWKEGYYKKHYFLWPFVYNQVTRLQTEDPLYRHGILPFYTFEKSNNLESACFVWPFFGYTHKKNPEYHERRLFWPIFVQGRGEIKYVNRCAPFYTHSKFKDNEKWWYAWPFLRIKHWKEGGLNVSQSQILYFLMWSNKQRHPDPSKTFQAHKTHIWPFVSMWDRGDGKKQFQMFSPFESFFPHNTIIRNVYTPLFALYRYEKNDTERYHRIFFNALFIKHSKDEKQLSLGPLLEFKRDPEGASLEIFKGLLGLQKKNGKRQIRFLWLTLGRS